YQTMREAEIIILDRLNRVVFANHSGYAQLQDLTKSPLIAAANSAANSVFEYGAHTASAGQVVFKTRTSDGAWLILIQEPLALIEREAARFYFITLVILLGTILISRAASRAVARKVTAPLEGVVEMVSEFAV